MWVDVRRGPRKITGAPPLLHGQRTAALALRREGPHAARLGGARRRFGGDRRHGAVAAPNPRERPPIRHLLPARPAARRDPRRDRPGARLRRFILGPDVVRLRARVRRLLRADHAVGVANGTDALTIALRAMGVGPGDEVVVPSFTFYASAEAIPPTGATPVFCDIDLHLCVTADTVRAALHPAHAGSPRRALVRQCGAGRGDRGAGRPRPRGRRPGRRARGSPAGRPGALGTAATFSFFPSENLGVRRRRRDHHLRFQYRRARTHAALPRLPRQGHLRAGGYNSRLDELQAATLRVQLPHSTRGPRAAAPLAPTTCGSASGELVALPSPAAGAEPAWHLYVMPTLTPSGSNRARPPPASATSPTTAPPSTASPRCSIGCRFALPATEHAAPRTWRSR